MLGVPEIVGLTLLALVFALWYQYRRNMMSTLKKMNIPGPEPHLIFGNLLDFIKLNPLGSQREWSAKYGKTFGYYFGATPVIVVGDAEALRLIQIKDFQNFMNRPSLIPGGVNTGKLFNNHVIRQRDQNWKNQRAILTPSFTSGKMKQMNPIVQQAVEEFIGYVDKHSASGREFDIYPMFKALTLDVIGRAAFGIETNVQKNPKTDEFLLTVQDVLKEDSISGLALIGACLPELSPILLPVRKITAFFRGLSGRSRLQELAENCEAIVKSRRSNPQNRRQDLLQLMLDAQLSQKEIQNMKGDALTAGYESDVKKTDIPRQGETGKPDQKKVYYMNDDEVMSNTFIVLFAGFDTTSNALAFTAHVLVNRPDIQDKIREEVKELFQKDGFLDFTNVSRCKYLDQVLTESLRYYPPVAGFVSRETASDITYGDRTIPKGVAVQIPLTIHRDPDYWQDPDVFDPERFSPENKKNHHPLAFQAFGAGPRNCIGMRFAQMEAKLALASLLLKYKLVPGENTEMGDIQVVYRAIIMSPKKGVFMHAVPVN